MKIELKKNQRIGDRDYAKEQKLRVSEEVGEALVKSKVAEKQKEDTPGVWVEACGELPIEE